MDSPKLTNLPPPPSGKVGWPWIDTSPQPPNTLINVKFWPRISIVTPSYNQGPFIEEAIRSVLLQRYPNLEYLIIDGGSTDDSVEIIQKYSPWLSYWVSESDRGQAHAINKGFQKTSGDIVGWLNSDDLYEPGSLYAIARTFVENPTCSVVFGDCYFVDEANKATHVLTGIDHPFERKLQIWLGWHVPQPSTFVKHQVLERVGLLDETLNYVLDYEWFLRISQYYSFFHLDKITSRYRIHRRSKTSDWSVTKGDFLREGIRVSRQYWGGYNSSRFWRMQQSLHLYRLRIRAGSALRVLHGVLTRNKLGRVQ
jgi:glycosyltransferase involved in cell wall biosynthesis